MSVRETEWQKPEKSHISIDLKYRILCLGYSPFPIVSKSSLIMNYIYSLNCTNFIVQEIATLLL